MATLVMSAAGAAIGGSLGGSIMGVSAMALGKAAGAVIGNSVDQIIMGQGAATVETGRVQQFRIMGAREGSVLPRVYGRDRIAGQLIWSSRFQQHVHEEDVGGKGGGGTVREFSYSINLAVALCQGEILRIGRIWADGQPLDQSDLDIVLYLGTEDQLPDPTIQVIEGKDNTPAYRGTAYVVFKNLPLGPFGNRIPQFNFEVFRRPARDEQAAERPVWRDVRGVALVPGTGEYSLATEPVRFVRGKGNESLVNVHNDLGKPDLVASLEQLNVELPNSKAVSLVVTWFGNDLRCGHCDLRPMVEQKDEDGHPIAWSASGVNRRDARMVSKIDDRPAFGGTPADRTVVQSIRMMRSSGSRVMFYPFILMDIMKGNKLPDPWSDEPRQPAVPWRGRITLSIAPGRAGSPDKTPQAADEVAAFFGLARPGDFEIRDGLPSYRGASDWGYRRFILHYAHLCAAAGGVDAFCIGSELRGLTQIRDGVASYPVVRELCRLARDVRAILGPDTKIGYAADWSEYFGHQPGDGSGDAIFHLDPLWALDAIDFIGIDNYMPLSDWRDGADHIDAHHGSIYDLDYLRANVAGGEGYDWYYANAEDRAVQNRLKIEDGAHGEDWIYRYKDIRNWWSHPHHDRIGGARSAEATDWVPGSKPVWFTELGCPAVDKGTNQPNVFYDPKSSESALPYFSNGIQDEYLQNRYLRAMYDYWNDAENNPVSPVYASPMVDMANAYVWAWDARPWPDFPGRLSTWVDGTNYELGHWLNGRAALCTLAEIVSDLCSGVDRGDLELADLHGSVTGYTVGSIESARQSIQPLMLAYAFDCFDDQGRIAFRSRAIQRQLTLEPDAFVWNSGDPALSVTRTQAAEMRQRVALNFVRSDSDYASGCVEAISGAAEGGQVSLSDVPIVMPGAQAKGIVERWTAEAHVAAERVTFSLPPSKLAISPGDVVELPGPEGPVAYRVDRVEEAGHRKIDASRIERAVYTPAKQATGLTEFNQVTVPSGVHVEFLDLPLLTGDEVAHAPHIAATRKPWTGPVSVYLSSNGNTYSLNCDISRPAIIGETLGTLMPAGAGRWSNATVGVLLGSGNLQRREELDVLSGANGCALWHEEAGEWEIVQFQDAVLVDSGRYVLSRLLRGQAGTDHLAERELGAGATFVMLDGALRQVNLRMSALGLARHYKIGPSAKPLNSYFERIETAEGIGLRPYRPVHLRAVHEADGVINLSWVRRTRLGGDNWAGLEVPLGEDREQYHLRIVSGMRTIHEAYPQTTNFAYRPEGDPSMPLHFEVAQVSGYTGPGPYASRTIPPI